MNASANSAVASPNTSDIPTVGNLDLDGARRYAARLQERWAQLQNQALAADRKLAVAQQALLSIPWCRDRAVAEAAIRAARELL